MLRRLARRVARRRLIRWSLQGSALAVICAGLVGLLSHWQPRATLAMAVALSLAALAIAFTRARQQPVSARDVARHLDRAHPELEESTELLLVPAECLTPLAALQQAHTRAALARVVPPSEPMPVALARTLALWAAAVALSGIAMFVPAREGPRAAVAPPRAGDGAAGKPATATGAAPRVTGATVVVRPPAYTRRPPRTSESLDLSVEQGAAVTWTLHVDRPLTSAWLIPAAGDSLPLVVKGTTATLSLTPGATVAYRFDLVSPDALPARTDYHRLEVVPDAEPVITVVKPEQRTVIRPGDAPAADLEALAKDDYAVTRVRIVATVSKGTGESIKFREDTLRFDAEVRRPGGGLLLRRHFDLPALGMAPGDELYFHVLAWDTRQPTPNLARSETFFIAWQDTAQAVVAQASPIAVTQMPEYFRSQRQIIIDTERLLQEKPKLRDSVFHDRSDAIGFDQGLLRKRYGQYAGDEFEAGGAGPDHGPTSTEDLTHRHDTEESVDATSTDPMKDLVHQHDTEENATRLAPGTRTLLKAALAQMWEAELRLRTGRPKDALPFEYRALELLKEVQQRHRSYVRKVGFEPPPLEPDKKRLSGKLEGIADRRRTIEPVSADSVAALRAALAALRADAHGNARGSIATLETAGRLLATRLLQHPAVDLSVLADLRSVIDSLSAGRAPSPGAVAGAERGLWNALPRPDALPERPAPACGLLERYRRRLGADR